MPCRAQLPKPSQSTRIGAGKCLGKPKVIFASRWMAVLGLSLLAGCGGGSGSGGSSAAVPKFSASPTSVSATASDPRGGIFRDVLLHASTVPEAIYLRFDYDYQPIAGIELLAAPAASDAIVRIYFSDPASIPAGTHDDSLLINACLDQDCRQPLDGSPIRIAVHYQVEARSQQRAQASLQTTYESVQARAGQAAPVLASTVTLSNPGAHPLFFRAELQGEGGRAIRYDAATGKLIVELAPPAELPTGDHPGSGELSVCYDEACSAPVDGSPLRLSYYYRVIRTPEPDRPLIALAESRALDHDVVDAEYSSDLDLLVVAARRPSQALHLYKLGDGSHRSVALDFAPTALSLSPDGSSAAVGHDGRISIVDLSLASPTVRLLTVSAPVFDLVYDGRGYVHAFPDEDQWVNIHTVRINTNTETLSSQSIYEKTRARLHPAGSSLYTMTTASFPNDLEKYNLPSLFGGSPSYVHDSPYHGEYDMCGNFWFDTGGSLIFTACGAIFRSSTTDSEDLLYDGKLLLSDPDNTYERYRIRHLSQSSSGDETALIEQSEACSNIYDSKPCRTHLNLYNGSSRTPSGSYALANVEIDGVTYPQHPEYVFHAASGSRYLLSQTAEQADDGLFYRLDRLQ